MTLIQRAAMTLAVVLLIAPVAGVRAAEPAIGQPAPAFTVGDSNGQVHSLADFRGRIVVLEWTNHQCPYVRKHYETGNMQALQRQAAEADVVWLTVISSAPGKQGHVDGAAANRLTSERGASPAAVLLDPDGVVGRAYAARTTPHIFVIDAEGVLVYKGGIDDKPTTDEADVATATNYVTATLANISAGEPVAEPVTRPYGCSVKYEGA